MNIKHKQEQTKSLEQELRHLDVYRAGMIIFTVLTREFSLCWHDDFHCAGMAILTVRTIFFGVLRKCYKITVPYNNFYLTFSLLFLTDFFLCVLFRGSNARA